MKSLNELSALIVLPSNNLSKILQAIDAGALQIALVVEDNKLVGLITDGDIRRYLLNSNSSLEISAGDVMNRDFAYVSESVSVNEVHRLMSDLTIHQIPVLSAEKEILGLHIIDEIHFPSHEDFTAVIMAGGIGKRLHPYTKDVPKPMLPINGQPMIEGLVNSLRTQGFGQIFISINHFGEQIENHFGNGAKFGVNIDYIKEPFPMGTAGSLSLLPEINESILVVNGDVLTNLNFSNVFKYHQKQDSLITVCIRSHEVQIPYAVVNIKNNKIQELVEKPTYSFSVNAGIYVLRPDVLKRIPNERYDMTVLLEDLINNDLSIGAFPMHENWRDIGTPMDYNAVNK
jgi:dTDP-glucose pyrophosphorylase